MTTVTGGLLGSALFCIRLQCGHKLHDDWALYFWHVHTVHDGSDRKALLLPWLPFRLSGLQTKPFSGQRKMHDLHASLHGFLHVHAICAMGPTAR